MNQQLLILNFWLSCRHFHCHRCQPPTMDRCHPSRFYFLLTIAQGSILPLLRALRDDAKAKTVNLDRNQSQNVAKRDLQPDFAASSSEVDRMKLLEQKIESQSLEIAK